MKNKSVVKLVLLFSLVLSPTLGHADPEPGEEMFIFHLGYFLPSFDTKLRVNNDAGQGDDVNAEDDLGLDSQETIIRGDVTWRISPRNRLTLGYFNFGRTGTRTIDKEIEIGDEIYPVGATLDTDFNFTVIPISYYFSFYKSDELEFGAGLGLQWSVITLDIEGSASAGNLDGNREARADASAPLPLLGVDLKYYIFPTWSVGGNIGAFAYKVGAGNMTMQGNVYSAAINTDYWFSEYVGAGLAINAFAIDVDVAGAKWNGNFNYQYWGPQVFLSGRF